MATYRGQDGNVKLGATQKVGEIFGWTVTANLATLQTTVMGQKWETYKPGLGSWTATARARFDYGDTLGQKVLVDAILNAVPTGDVADVRFVMDDDPKEIHGAAIVNSVAITAELTNIIEAAFSFQGTGPLAITWT